MKLNRTIKNSRELSKPYRVTDGKGFRLKHFDPGDIGDLKSEDKPGAKEALQAGVEALSELQDVLYAQDRWSLLLIFQAMDAAGKDGAIKHVMSGVNPQGCQVYSFKSPSAEELDHDYLWRCMRCLPNRGHIGIFNRSYYEETLIVRVHPEILAGQKIPPELVTKHIWDERFQGHPRLRALPLAQRHRGAEILPSSLEAEQRKRFLARLDNPTKTGNSRPTTQRSGDSGTITRRHTRRSSARRPRRNRPGMWCLPTTNGTQE